MMSEKRIITPLLILGEGARRAGEVNKMMDLARKLRRESTEAEQLFWHFLRNRKFFGFRFKRQRIVKPYIVDFVCLSHKLIIEVDGSHHLDNQKYDAHRTKYLESLGFSVLRFWNNDVLQNTHLVLETIFIKLEREAKITSPGLRPPSPEKQERGMYSLIAHTLNP